jgi:protein-tyrosine phosphatase
MAEALLRQALPGRVVRSAGTGALVGRPAEPFAVQLMSETGIDISSHRAQQVFSGLTTQAELILVMDIEQKEYVERRFVGTRGKVFRICEAAKLDVPDPYREGVEHFRASLKLIEEGVSYWSEQIKNVS